MRHVSPEQKIDIARSPDFYQSVASVAQVNGVLVCSFRRSDQHLCTNTDVMVTRSLDGGLTWDEPRSLAHADVHNEGAVYIAPQLSALKDGRLVIIVDRGVRRPDERHVSLFHWQKPDRGMSNWLFWSDDAGEAWTGPVKIDDVGGEPSYIADCGDELLFTRILAKPRTQRVSKYEYEGANPPYAYYACDLAASRDGGRTWERKCFLSDDYLYSDAEVGLMPMGGGIIQAHARCCDHATFFGQSSRRWISRDNGVTWGKPALLPYHGHRICVGRLQSGKALATFRNAYGTTGSYAFLFDPDEPFGYEPNSFIWRGERCRIEDRALVLDTGEGWKDAAEFVLYPAEDTVAEVEAEFELRVEEADAQACTVSAGCYIHFVPGKVFLGDRPDAFVALDTGVWHTYRALRSGGRIRLWVDGELKLDEPLDGIGTRMVRFGNRLEKPDFPNFVQNTGRSFWRNFKVRVANRDDHAIDWKWDVSSGFPDQFRRDRLVCLDRCERNHWGDNGYSGWTQLPDGTIVITDYTDGNPGAERPFIRAYRVREEDLL